MSRGELCGAVAEPSIRARPLQGGGLPRRDLIFGGASFGLAMLAAHANAFSQTKPEGSAAMKASKGSYAQANGIDLYYEVHGSGAPLILLHGGLGTIDAIFGKLLPVLAAHRQVIAVELQGHGHTPDNGRKMTYEAMADDIAALVHHLHLKQVDAAGYSVGGGVTLQLGLRHPDLVRKLVVISAPHASDGWFPEVIRATSAMDPEAMKQSPWYQAYLKAAPRPQDWPLLVRNVSRLMSSQYDWSAAIANDMTAPVLTVNGDADSVRPSHALTLFELLGGAQADGFAAGRPASELLVVPATNHLEILDREMLPPAILGYLDRGLAQTPAFNLRL